MVTFPVGIGVNFLGWLPKLKSENKSSVCASNCPSDASPYTSSMKCGIEVKSRGVWSIAPGFANGPIASSGTRKPYSYGSVGLPDGCVYAMWSYQPPQSSQTTMTAH